MPTGGKAAPVSAEIIAEVAAGGAADAGGVSVELLGDFLTALAHAVVAGRPLSRRQMAAYQAIGDTAARQGVALRALLDLYLSAAWRLWRHQPPVREAQRDPAAVVVAGEVMLHAVDDAVAAIAEGFQLARRSLVRAEESARREFIEDLLTGGADLADVLRRADGYGLDLSGPHAVAVVLGPTPFSDGAAVLAAVERAVLGRKGDADALVASKEGRLVVVFPAPDAEASEQVLARLARVLGPSVAENHWQIGVGRPGPGAHGVVSSYQEARDALLLAERVKLSEPIVHARDLLVYNVLLRDRAAITDLVETLLSPLRAVRGAAALLDTLAAYFGSGGNAAQTARTLHLSVRAVTYRLDRVRSLTGLDPASPTDRFSLHVAVLGAKLLDWPEAPGR
ncbi:MAG: CdaR family transcriptional regulator [Frankiales bacterium]|nr:CdaR family transcriptional regulator [Frankiales bacterium]